MRIVDVGTGTPIVVVPGIQGRWEWMEPAVSALARNCRVITFSLADEPSCGARFEEADGLECYVQQIGRAMDAAGLHDAALCGVSYGGLVASLFAARYPHRVRCLTLVSALPPSWKPDARASFYLRAPWLLSPLFVIASCRNMKEIAAAHGGLGRGLIAAARQGGTVLRHMFHPGRMARRVRWLSTVDLGDELRTVKGPALVITGEGHLDRVVPVKATLEYLAMWPHAVHATIERTGHLGLITRPEEFARVVASFVEATRHDEESRRRVV